MGGRRIQFKAIRLDGEQLGPRAIERGMIALSGIRRVRPVAGRTRERVIAAIARTRIGGAIGEQRRGDIATEHLAIRAAARIETNIGEAASNSGVCLGYSAVRHA
jgi:hypothetical protein